MSIFAGAGKRYAPLLESISKSSTKRQELEASMMMAQILQEAERRRIISAEQSADKKNWLTKVAGGAGLGATLGSFWGPFGTAVGGAIGAGAGLLIGGAQAIGQHQSEGNSSLDVFDPRNLGLSQSQVFGAAQTAASIANINTLDTRKAAPNILPQKMEVPRLIDGSAQLELPSSKNPYQLQQSGIYNSDLSKGLPMGAPQQQNALPQMDTEQLFQHDPLIDDPAYASIQSRRRRRSLEAYTDLGIV